MSTYIPIEIQLEIMKRFPIKSLIQFRSVCKQWKSFIDSSAFVANYNNTNSHKHNNLLLVKYNDVDEDGNEEQRFVSIVDDDDVDDDIFPQQELSLITFPIALKQQLNNETTVIVGSSRGLVCFYDYSTKYVVIWNPSIRKSVTIYVQNYGLSIYEYAFVIGFWVCPRTNDPKLIKINYTTFLSQTGDTIPHQVEVFSLSSGVWRCTTTTNLPSKSIKFTIQESAGPQLVIDGFLYWLVYDRDVLQEYDDAIYTKPYPLIMSFHVITEEFKQLYLPDCFIVDTRHTVSLSISTLNGSLVIVQLNKDGHGFVCNIWMMIKHGVPESFTKLFTIKKPMPMLSSVCLFRNSGQVILSLIGGNYNYQDLLYVYEPWSQHIRYIGITGKQCSFLVCSYTESLLLLDHTPSIVDKQASYED